MGRIYADARVVLVLGLALSNIALHDNGLVGRGQGPARNLLIQAPPWMARSWPRQEAALASSLYIKFADEYIRYEHIISGMAATLDAILDQEHDTSRLQWLSFSGRGFSWRGFLERGSADEDMDLGQARPCKPGDDFVKVWNLLSKRTTSYPVDIPAIFAALLYQSAGEILCGVGNMVFWWNLESSYKRCWPTPCHDFNYYERDFWCSLHLQLVLLYIIWDLIHGAMRMCGRISSGQRIELV
ncbi:hypothetical protein GGR51DRAFT_506065 [Nemania sp. FL0031]|nr:hypothetical protein GGR51DRAFT_506065 [Nemania sp. FL0031]